MIFCFVGTTTKTTAEKNHQSTPPPVFIISSPSSSHLFFCLFSSLPSFSRYTFNNNPAAAARAGAIDPFLSLGRHQHAATVLRDEFTNEQKRNKSQPATNQHALLVDREQQHQKTRRRMALTPRPAGPATTCPGAHTLVTFNNTLDLSLN